jgi:hypothetical protein
MKNGISLSPKQHDVIQTFIVAIKAKRKTESKSKDAPRKTHNA